MSYRVILVPILHDAADAAALAVAKSLLELGPSHVVGVHVRMAPSDLIASADYMPLASLEMLDEHDRQRAAEARNRFATWRQANGLELRSSPQPDGGSSADWHEKLAPVGAEIGRLGRVSDLIVLARPPRSYSATADEALEGALFGSGRPVVIVPEEMAYPLQSTVVIGWNDSREAARAVAAAWPLLVRAERVVLFIGGGDAAIRDSADRLSDHLAWHGCKRPTVVADASRDVAVALLEVAGRERAGLIVMGAYTHSRLQQFVLGGTTTDMFRLCRIPLLMTH